jgi:hypothetical protein
VGRNKTKYIFNGLALLRDFERTFFHLAPLSECTQNYIYEEVTKAFLQHFSKRVDSFRVTGNSALRCKMVPQKVSTLVILQTPGMVQTCGLPDPNQSDFSLFPKFPKAPHTVYVFAVFTFLTILNLNHKILNYYSVFQ